jgi:hypothetical protein
MYRNDDVPMEHLAMIVAPIHAGRGLLSALPPHLTADLFDDATPAKLNADEVLFLAGDAGDGCYRLEEGLLKVTMVSRSGTERILAFLGPGKIVGELSMIDGRPRSATLIAARLRETDAAVAAGSFLPLRGRVALTFLEDCRRPGRAHTVSR